MKKRKKSNWLKKSFRLVGMDPISYEESWKIVINRFQIISLIVIFLIFISFLNFLLFSYTPLGYLLPENIKNKNKQEIREAAIRVANLEKKLATQDRYISNLQGVILGEISIDSIYYLDNDASQLETNFGDIDTVTSEAEEELDKNLKVSLEKLKQQQENPQDHLYLFDPIVGELSQGFHLPNHPGVDLVAKENAQIRACLDGIVLHATYDSNDGYTIILSHKNDITSVYKHAKSVSVKVGDHVKTGDAIGIVGNTGERSTGPHLHFELWNVMGPLNPIHYFSFGK